VTPQAKQIQQQPGLFPELALVPIRAEEVAVDGRSRWQKRKDNRLAQEKALQKRYTEIYNKPAKLKVNGKIIEVRTSYEDIVTILMDEFHMERSVVKRKLKGS